MKITYPVVIQTIAIVFTLLHIKLSPQQNLKNSDVPKMRGDISELISTRPHINECLKIVHHYVTKIN